MSYLTDVFTKENSDVCDGSDVEDIHWLRATDITELMDWGGLQIYLKTSGCKNANN